MKRFLEIFKIEKTFPTPAGPVVAVKDFDLVLAEGEFVSIIGPSGCGKSTVLSIVAGLTSATLGGVVLAGKEVLEPGPDRGVVFQAPCLLPWLSAIENVVLGVDEVCRTKTKRERLAIAQHYLELVGLAASLHKKPRELSAGMRQRVGLARAFALSPKLLLLDEPFGMLDSLTRIELHEVLLDLWGQNKKTALMVTHDVDEALYLSDRVALMTQGPEARVAGVITVPFARPRERAAVREHPRYYELRESLISFLEEACGKPPAVSLPPPVSRERAEPGFAPAIASSPAE